MRKQNVCTVTARHPLKKLPNQIDLRFFAKISFGDTLDGRANVSTGFDFVAIIYGNKIVWEEHLQSHHGMTVGRRGHGNALYEKMYRVSKLFLKIQRVALLKYYKDGLYYGEEYRKTKREGGKNWDIVYPNRDIFAILEKHPQFREMVRKLGTVLSKTKCGGYRINVTKGKTAPV
jgi:hypothetical protein